ncbi:LLM class flavin-dependent oxidoreductase [Martelella alba]|uniref:LLM class flavin-dependent oxidoreductase n=1 Tax=Martelella alba TaxID=2590451 RepID=A0A506UEV4_9HYPH|nr:LLM class flavin-dependent oxidoreductase [Martelella alba]TPW32238.1 LLM class flavin-dependent oxidoreductase [Martelella alba]
MAHEIGFSLEGGENWTETLAMAKMMDEGGVDTLWLACHLFQREPIVRATAILGATKRLKVALMAMSPFSMHPVYIAMAAATLDEMFPGRVTLCLGVGAPRDLEAAGIAAEKPLPVMRETVDLVRALLSGETVAFAGRHFNVSGRALETGQRAVPIILAASREKMLHLAGSHADGLLISAATSVPFIESCFQHVAAGEAEAGRRGKRIGLVYCAIEDEAEKAYDGLRRKMAFILRGMHHKQNIVLGGATLDQQALAKAYADSDWDGVDRLVSDDVVRRHAIAGTAEDAARRMSEYETVGLDQLVISGVKTADELQHLLDHMNIG